MLRPRALAEYARRGARCVTVVTLMLEISGPDNALLDEPFALRARGAGPDAQIVWHARLRDDDGLVFRARADRAEDLPGAWRGKAEHAALGSLRPLRIDVRAEAADGQAAGRTITRRLLADGVRIRRWRDDVRATLYLPADAPVATVLVTGEPAAAAVALLASRGVLVLVLPGGDLGAARERLAAVPGAGTPRIVEAGAVPLPPGAPGGDRGAWETHLSDLRAPGHRSARLSSPAP
jgi:hypothetical protein